VDSVTSVIDDNWHHIAVTHDKSTGATAVYVDGQSEGTATITFDLTFPGVNRIGTGFSDLDEFNGTIDDVMIFNRSLSAGQINALYENRTDLIVSQQTSAGEVWQACVTQNNGTEDGSELCSNNLTVLVENQHCIYRALEPVRSKGSSANGINAWKSQVKG